MRNFKSAVAVLAVFGFLGTAQCSYAEGDHPEWIMENKWHVTTIIDGISHNSTITFGKTADATGNGGVANADWYRYVKDEGGVKNVQHIFIYGKTRDNKNLLNFDLYQTAGENGKRHFAGKIIVLNPNGERKGTCTFTQVAHAQMTGVVGRKLRAAGSQQLPAVLVGRLAGRRAYNPADGSATLLEKYVETEKNGPGLTLKDILLYEITGMIDAAFASHAFQAYATNFQTHGANPADAIVGNKMEIHITLSTKLPEPSPTEKMLANLKPPTDE